MKWDIQDLHYYILQRWQTVSEKQPSPDLPAKIDLIKVGQETGLKPAYYWKGKPVFGEIKPNSLSMYHGKSSIGVVCFSASGVI